MDRLKICVYAIAKDEQMFVNRFLDSCQGADCVVVGVDPGDTTGDLLEARGAKVVRINLPQFRFDQYRNEVLKHVPVDVDVCVSLDLDEVLPKRWREKIESAWLPGTTRLNYKLRYSPDATFYYDRIHARHGYVWRHANHEAVYAIIPGSENVANSDLTVHHYPDDNKSRSKNLPLLRSAVDENPKDVRMRWYLGREYYYLGRYEDCIAMFRAYFDLSPSWAAQKCWAGIFVARSFKALKLPYENIAWLHFAISMCADLRDPYIELAMVYSERLEWEMVLAECNRALRINDNRHHFHEGNEAYTELPYVVKCRAFCALNDHLGAELTCRKALRINPSNQEMIECLDTIGKVNEHPPIR